MNKLGLFIIFFTLTFTSAAQLTVVASDDTCILLGQDVMISAQASGGSAPYIFNWTPASSLGCGNCQSPLAAPIVTTTYTVDVIDFNGRTGSDVVTVFIGAFVDAGTDTTILNGDTVLIGGSPTASGGSLVYTYLWRPGGSLDDSTIANPLAFPGTATTYTVSVTDSNACVGTDMILVDMPTGDINNLDKDESRFLLYPNPLENGDQLRIIFNNPRPGKITLLNALGQNISEWIIEMGQTSFVLKDINLVPGIYLLSYRTSSYLSTKKLVID